MVRERCLIYPQIGNKIDTRMNTWIARHGAIILLIICLISVCGCLGAGSNTLPSDKYVAVEEYMYTNSTVIDGTLGPVLPHITLPVVFNYDGSINGSNWADGSSWSGIGPGGDYYPAVNDSFKVLYGTVYYRNLKPFDTRTGMRVRGVYNFPYEFQSGFSIDSVDKNGTIFGSYSNTSIALKVGEQWTTPVSSITRTENNTGLDQKLYTYTARYNTTWTITNIGILDKAKIAPYSNRNSSTGATNNYWGADPAE